MPAVFQAEAVLVGKSAADVKEKRWTQQVEEGTGMVEKNGHPPNGFA